MTAIVAGYAAIVSTGALALEVRRWFESGPRLTLSIIATAKFFGGPVQDDREFITARVTNRGALPTTITNYGLLEFRTPLHALLMKSAKAAVVPDPSVGGAGRLPHVLQPGTEWTGAAVYDEGLLEWVATGRLYVAMYSSHRSRPLLRRVVRGGSPA